MKMMCYNIQVIKKLTFQKTLPAAQEQKCLVINWRKLPNNSGYLSILFGKSGGFNKKRILENLYFKFQRF